MEVANVRSIDSGIESGAPPAVASLKTAWLPTDTPMTFRNDLALAE